MDKGFVEFREKYTSDVPKYGGAFIKGFEQGNKFTLHNIGETLTGKKISATFTVRKTPTKKFDFDYSPSRSWIWWYKNGEAGPVSPIGFSMGNTLNVEWDINFFDEVTKKPIKLGISNIFADLDYKQAVRYTYDDPNNLGVVVNSSDSQVVEKTVRGEKFWMGIKNSGGTRNNDDNSGLGRWKTGDIFYENANDEKDTPIGTVLSVGKGYTHHLTYLENGDWGLNPYSAAAAARYKEYIHEENRRLGKPIPSDYDLYESGYQFLLWGSGTSIDAVKPPVPPQTPTPPKLTQKDKETIEKPTPKPDDFKVPRPLEYKYKEKDKTPLTPPTEKPLLASPKDEPDKPHVPIPSEPPTPDLKPVPKEGYVYSLENYSNSRKVSKELCRYKCKSFFSTQVIRSCLGVGN